MKIEGESYFQGRYDNALMREFEINTFLDPTEIFKDDEHLKKDLEPIVLTPRFGWGLFLALRGMKKQLGIK